MKRLVSKLSEADLLPNYPVRAGVDGWYFRVSECSACTWLAEGTDQWGRRVSCQGADERTTLLECAAMAREVQQSLPRDSEG